MNYALRKANPSDAKRIEELFVHMLRTIYNTNEVKGYEPGYLDKFFYSKKDWICVAEDRGRIISFISIEVYEDEGFIYLDDLVVEKEYRNKGIGTNLILRAEEYAKEIGIREIQFHVLNTNTKAYKLYERLGYTKDILEDSYFRMTKLLN